MGGSNRSDMSIDELLLQLLGNDPQQVLPLFRQWLVTSRRFRTFAEQYHTKIRAKLRGAGDAEALHDLLFELEIAHWLLQEKRFHLAYEPQTIRTGPRPDFTVTLTTKWQFHVEVTRIHTTMTAESSQEEPVLDGYQRKLLMVILGKLSQIKAGAPNLLLIGLAPDLLMERTVDELIKQMKQRIEKNDLALLPRSRLQTPAAFFKQYYALSGILFYGLAQPVVPTATPPFLWLNKEAKYPLLTQVQTSLRQLATNE